MNTAATVDHDCTGSAHLPDGRVSWKALGPYLRESVNIGDTLTIAETVIRNIGSHLAVGGIMAELLGPGERS